ncbi:MAG: allophanate hydrolase [Solirubrobacteraceae bacterium]|nr:allophanate hydrolase [Solirubrobacteraceae bacterium]
MSTASPADHPSAAAHSARVAGVWAPESLGEVLGRVRSGASTPELEAAAALGRADAYGRPAAEGQGTSLEPAESFDPVWIDRLDAAAVAAGAAQSSAGGAHLPLTGVPVAIKGNIDVAGLPTTAACPSFADGPAAVHATAVQRLADAGAVIVGTTNLDQFATGLNGTRSPYGAPHAAGLPGHVSGGSSSGSAVAVARGDVPLALGTDTAGSGRVPAALNGIVGLKPSKGLVSTAGVLPACRSLDVVSVFAADVDSAALALTVLAGPDPADAWSRTADGFTAPEGLGALPPRLGAGRALRLGVPAALPEGTRIDPEAAAAWEAALAVATELAGEVELVPVDLEPFFEAGSMLYGSAFVAERYASVGTFIEQAFATDPGDTALDPTVRDLVLAGASPSAATLFDDLDRIRVLSAGAHATLATVDALLTPTVLEHPTHEELAADPVGANARLGLFTTFGNLLDLAVLALPAARRCDGLPFGVSFHAPAFQEARVLELGARFEAAVRDSGAPVGTGDVSEPTLLRPAGAPPATDAEGRLLLAVGGAHMAGLPLNHELTGAGGEYLRLTRTSPDYVLHVLDTPLGPRPGIERVGRESPATASTGGLGVEVELWALPSEALGSFVHRVPPHLALGPITLLDGSTAIGFLGAASDEVTSSRLVPSWRHFARGL